MGRRKSLVMTLVFAALIAIFTIRFTFFETPVPNVSAVTTTESLGVYWDENFNQPVFSIDWGVLSPGQLREVIVWVQNEGSETLVLALTTLNWNPENASQYLTLAWSYKDTIIEAGQAAKIALSLSVSPKILGIYDFSFDITIGGRKYGDINRDGIVNVVDCAIMSAAYGSTPTHSNWNPDADLNDDGVVDWIDFQLLSSDLFKSLGT